MPNKLSKIELPNGNEYTIVDRTLTAGENITITEDSTTGVRTISSTGGDYVEPYKITLTYNSSTDTLTSDKTYAEITSAYNSGKYLYVCNPSPGPAGQGGDVIAPLTSVSVSDGIFTFKFESMVEYSLITYVISDSVLFYNELDFAWDGHTHGNITSDGDITSTSTIASGDRLVINDESESQLTNSSITFGTSTTQFLANNGTWRTPAGGTGTITGITTSAPLSGSGTSGSVALSHATSGVTAQTTQAVYPFTVNATGHITGVGSAQTIPNITVSSTQPTGVNSGDLWIKI